MPRTPRKGSISNIYHVMIRGINRQNIFETDEDRRYFMIVMNRCREVSGFKLHAFALMSNHVHLLIEPSDESLDLIFKRIGTRYAVWFNRKYQRAGHLFQDRYRSECVETDEYYKTVLRYILQNPMKAGLESCPGSYKWSSYAAYIKGRGILTDTEYATALFGGREALTEYLAQDNDDHVMDEGDHDWRLRDDEAKAIMNRLTNCASVSDFQRLDASVQKECAWALYQKKLSLGQIARLTGMSKATVFRAVKHQRNMILEENTDLIMHEADMEDGYDVGLPW